MKAFGIAGYSGAGKTTLIEALIPLFRADGLRVSLVKHTHHGFDIDRPGKDSYRFREAGALEVLLAGNQRWALMHELGAEQEPLLSDLLARLSDCELVLVEGFRSNELPKIEVHRPSAGHDFIYPKFPNVVAIASDAKLNVPLPVLELNQPRYVAVFIKEYLAL